MGGVRSCFEAFIAQSHLIARPVYRATSHSYTGRAIKWDWAMNASKQDLTPPTYELGPLPVAPVPMPGKTQLV